MIRRARAATSPTATYDAQSKHVQMLWAWDKAFVFLNDNKR
jgi:hypothetical protein